MCFKIYLLLTLAALLTLGAHAQRGFRYLVCKCVSQSVILSVTTFSATTGSSLHRLHFKKGDFRITAALVMA